MVQGCVSPMTSSAVAPDLPPNMTRIQKAHRQPRCSEMNPLTTGPRTYTTTVKHKTMHLGRCVPYRSSQRAQTKQAHNYPSPL